MPGGFCEKCGRMEPCGVHGRCGKCGRLLNGHSAGGWCFECDAEHERKKS